MFINKLNCGHTCSTKKFYQRIFMVSHSLILPKVNGLLYEVNIQYIITFLWLLRCERVQIQVPGGITAKITDKTAAVRQTDRQTCNHISHGIVNGNCLV